MTVIVVCTLKMVTQVAMDESVVWPVLEKHQIHFEIRNMVEDE